MPIEYAVFGKDPEGIYEELSESKKGKDFIFAVERNTSQVNFGKDDVLTVKVSDEERFLMPEQGDFLIHRLFLEKFCVTLCLRQSLYSPNTVPHCLEHPPWWKACFPLMGLEST